MRKLYFYIPLFLCLIFLASIVFAQETINIDFSKVSNWFSDFLGIPRNWMTTKMILRYVMLPFLAVFIAVLGIMRDIMLFRRSRHLDWILALVITFIVLPWSGIFGHLILFLYGLGGVLSALAVGFLICAGAVMWSWGGFQRLKFNEVDLAKGKIKYLARLRKDVKLIQKQIMDEWTHSPPDTDKIAKLEESRAKLNAEIKEREHHL